GETPESKPGHERRHDNRRGVHVAAAEEQQYSLPDDLVDERGAAAREERTHQENARTVDTVPGRRRFGDCYSRTHHGTLRSRHSSPPWRPGQTGDAMTRTC